MHAGIVKGLRIARSSLAEIAIVVIDTITAVSTCVLKQVTRIADRRQQHSIYIADQNDIVNNIFVFLNQNDKQECFIVDCVITCKACRELKEQSIHYKSLDNV